MAVMRRSGPPGLPTPGGPGSLSAGNWSTPKDDVLKATSMAIASSPIDLMKTRFDVNTDAKRPHYRVACGYASNAG